MGAPSQIDTNLQGQRLGRKGRDTRERILNAAREIIAEEDAEQPTLSAVARRAGIGLPSIYNYFADLSELVLALLEPLLADAEEGYIRIAQDYWADEDLDERCAAFVGAFHEFWRDNTRLLHLRNAISDQHDRRVAQSRIQMARTVIRLLGWQMGASRHDATSPEYDLASVLFTGLERVVTIATDERWKALYPSNIKPRFEGKTLEQQTRLLRLAIADERARLAREATE